MNLAPCCYTSILNGTSVEMSHEIAKQRPRIFTEQTLQVKTKVGMQHIPMWKMSRERKSCRITQENPPVLYRNATLGVIFLILLGNVYKRWSHIDRPRQVAQKSLLGNPQADGRIQVKSHWPQSRRLLNSEIYFYPLGVFLVRLGVVPRVNMRSLPSLEHWCYTEYVPAL